MSLRPIGEIIGELLPKIAERYRAQQMRDNSQMGSERTHAHTNQRPPSDRTVGNYIATATTSAEGPPV